MTLAGKRIGFALTGSHCTFEAVYPALENLIKSGCEVIPIVSDAVAQTDTRFGKASEHMERLEKLTGKRALCSIPEVEPIGPKKLLDMMIIAPCTGNTLAKLSTGITDGPVLMATKAHLRNGRPVLLALSTNDGLGLNAKNIGVLLAARNFFFVPFGQDDPHGKPTSLVARMEFMVQAAEAALAGRQLQPLLVGPAGGHTP